MVNTTPEEEEELAMDTITMMQWIQKDLIKERQQTITSKRVGIKVVADVKTEKTPQQNNKKEQMKKRGDEAVTPEGGFNINIKMEWVQEKQNSPFNIRAAIIGVIKVMKTVDKDIKIKSKETGEQWEKMEDIPKGKAFKNAFEVKQELFGKEGIRLVAFATLISQFKLNTMKFDSHVFRYLQMNNVYIKQDFFERNNTVSPGIITCVHPTFVQRDDLTNEIHNTIKKHRIPTNKITSRWTHENEDEADLNPIPKFRIVKATQKYGNNADRIKTTVLKILCAEKDGLYLKSIMAATWEKEGKPQGIFVPARTNLVTSPAVYKQLLKNHNRYLNQTSLVVAEGIKLDKLNKKAKNEGLLIVKRS